MKTLNSINVVLLLASLFGLTYGIQSQLDEDLGTSGQTRPRTTLSRKSSTVGSLLSGHWFLCKRGDSIEACRQNENREATNSPTFFPRPSLDLFNRDLRPRRTFDVEAHCTAELCAHGRCTNGRCVCEAGWEGRFCSKDVDECGEITAPCSQFCINTIGSYKCQCNEHYTLSNNLHTCIRQMTEPNKRTSFHRQAETSELTQMHSQLRKNPRSSTIQRREPARRISTKRSSPALARLSGRGRSPPPATRPFNDSPSINSIIKEAEVAGKGAMRSIGRFLSKLEILKHRMHPISKLKGMTVVHPCARAKCHHKCVLTVKNMPRCLCRRGYVLNTKTRRCIDRNECHSGINACPEHSTCYNKLGGYSCKCNSGFILAQNSTQTTCQDVNECLTGDHICSDQAKCINKPGYHLCKCMERYVGDGINCSLGVNNTVSIEETRLQIPSNQRHL